MAETHYKRCRACRASGRTTTIFPSNVRAWESERCFECHKAISDVGGQLERAERNYNALLSIQRLLVASRDFVSSDSAQ